MDENLDRLKIRKIIKQRGFGLYLKLGKKSSHLQAIAGEFMLLNEDYVMNNKNNIGVTSILNTGFTANQEILLLELEKELE